MRKLIVLVAITVAALYMASIASAKRHPPPPPPPPPPATLLFTPGSPITAYTGYTITGCNYPASATLTLAIENSTQGYYWYFTIQTDSTGCLTTCNTPLVSPPCAYGSGPPGTYQEIAVYGAGGELSDGVIQVFP